MRIRPENVRLRSKIYSISLPETVADDLDSKARSLGKKPSRLISEIVVDALGGNPNDLRFPGNPNRKEPDYWDQIKARMKADSGLDMSLRDIKRMFPKPPEVPE